MKLQTTKNYGLFIANSSQRVIEHSKVKGIAESISKHGYRPSKPLQCYQSNSGLIIVDGHHRLEAAKLAGSAVFYVIEKADAQETMIDVNRLVKKWTAMDYVRLYAFKGKKDYQTLLFYIDKGIPLSFAASMMINQSASSGNAMKQIATGLFRVKTLDGVEKVVDLIVEFQESSPAIKSRPFITAISKCLLYEGFSFDLFVKRMRENIGMLEKTSNEEQMLLQIESIYNYRSRKPIPLRFAVVEATKSRSLSFKKQ